MKKLLISLLFLLAFTATTLATDVNIGPSTIPGFQPANLPPDVTVTASVLNGSPVVTCSSCFRQQWVGMGGFRVSIVGVPYTVSFVSSKSSLTLTTNYAAGDNPTATVLWHKYVELRVYADSAFQPAGETYVVQPGAPGSGAWHRRVAASIVNEFGINNLYIPQITLDSTTDSITNQAARYYAAFYRPEGAFIQTYDCFESFALPPTGASTWPDICLFNSRQVIVQDDSTYNKTQIDSFRTGCTSGQMLFYSVTGLKPACLIVGTGLQITGDTLSATAGSSYQTILEEGSPLTQRATLNFIGSGLTAADNAGAGRTDITVDSDLNALASNATNGFWARTGAGTGAARTILGTASRIVVTDGDGVAGNPTIDLFGSVVVGPGSATDNAIARFDGTTGALLQNSAVTVADTSGNFSVPNGWTFANPAGSSLAINGSGLDVVLTSAASSASGYQAFRLATGAQTQSSGSTLGLAVVPTYNQSGTAGSEDLVLARVETALGSGQHNFIRGAGGAAGATNRFRINNLGNYFFGSSGGFIGDENGNEYLSFATAASAVNNLEVGNAATGLIPFIRTVGGDANISMEFFPKGTGVAKFTGSAGVNIEAGVPALRFVDTDHSKTLRIAADNTVWNFVNDTTAETVLSFDTTSGVGTFSDIPILPASNPTTANQAARKQYVDDTRTAFSACWFYSALPAAVETTESVGRWIVPSGQDITIEDITLVWATGADSSASNIFTIKRRNSAGTAQADVGTLEVNTPAQNVLSVNNITDVPLTAGDQLYPLFTTRTAPASETNITACARGTQKRIP